MIFDFLNLSENEPLNTKLTNKNIALNLINKGDKENNFFDTTGQLEVNKDKSNNPLSFVEQLQYVTESHELELEERIPVEKLELEEIIPVENREDGNSLPFLDQIQKEVDNNLVQSINGYDDMDSGNKVQSYDDIDKLIVYTDDTIQDNLKILSSDARAFLPVEPTVSEQIVSKIQNLITHSNTIENDGKAKIGIIAEITNPTQTEKLVTIEPTKIVDKMLVDIKLPLAINNSNLGEFSNTKIEDETVNLLNEKKITPKRDLISDSLLELKQPVKVKNSVINIQNRNLASNEKVSQESTFIRTAPVIENLQLSNSESNLNTLIPITSNFIKPVSETTTFPEQMTFRQPLNINGQFVNGLGGRIQWMLQQAVASAEIMLDPPELGPINIKLVQAGTETNIIFQVSSLQGKEAIEDNLAKLKMMLLSQGLSLGETEIQQKEKENATEEENNKQALDDQINNSELDDEQKTEGELVNHSTISLLDTYI